MMIDEAMVPLIISGLSGEEEPTDAYLLADELVDELVATEDYEIDPKNISISLTSRGRFKSHALLKDRSVSTLTRPWTKYVENALLANNRFLRDQHYVLRDGEVQIVDQNTGRIFADRTWRDGLHQAVEAKEGVEVRPSQQSTNRITRQRFFGFYERVAGLTGTVTDSADEIQYFYNLDVVQIPTNVQCKRQQLRSRFFASNQAKHEAIVQSVRECHDRRQPVLVGTTTIDESRRISALLSSQEIVHCVLNGVQDEDEAVIISRAGRAGSVLVATNMAGRGTDIKPCREAKSGGGLHVIAAQHATSPRIDRQLVGRSARQGDPGSCQYFASAEDELIAKYSPELAKRIAADVDATGESPQDYSREIAPLQRRVEALHFDMRKRSVQSDAWMDQLRETLH